MPKVAADGIDKTTLRRLDISKLSVGDALPGSIRAANGRVLIRPGRMLRQDDLELLGDHLEKGIYGDSEWPETALHPDEQATPTADFQVTESTNGDLVPITLDDLRIGQQLPHALYDRNGTLLASAGVEVTRQFLAQLNQQGLIAVHADKADIPESSEPQPQIIQSRLSKHLDTLVATRNFRELQLVNRRGPRPHLELAGLRIETKRAQQHYVKAVARVEEISSDLFRGKPASISAATEVIADFMDMVRLDGSLIPAIVRLKESPGEYLFDHGMNGALLAMAMATEFALPRESILQIGLGALLKDVGMMQVPEELRLAPRLLTSEEHAEISRHPIYTLDFLQKLDGLSETSLLVAYQAHERIDCSGYPRRRHRTMIHPFARIAAAADAYSAMIAHRPHRNAWKPHQAMETMLREVARGRFDPNVVRTLIDCLSLFPIGSYVRLSDGTVAKVIRANHGMHTKPVVVPLNPDGSETDMELDLRYANSIRVVQALGEQSQLKLAFFKTGRDAS